MAVISTVEGSGFVPEIWLARALGRLRNYLTLQRTVTMNTDLAPGESFSVGKVLHLPKRGALTVNQKTETGNYTIQNPQSSTVDLVLNHHPEVSFGLTSEVIAFQNQDQAVGYVEDAIIALAEDIDLSLMNIWKLVAAANTVTNAGTITEANILSARKILRDNKARPGIPMFGVISTAQEAAVLQLTNLVRYDAIGVSNNVTNATVGAGDNAVRIPGAIGRAYSFEMAPSQLVFVSAANDNTLQTVAVTGTPTGGSLVLIVGGQTTTPLPFNATAAQVQAALGALSSVGVGNVFCSGGPWANGTITVAFQQNAGAITSGGIGSLVGGTPVITIAQATQAAGAKNLFYTQDAILMATRSLPLPDPGTGALGTVMTDPETGITMRLVKSWNPNQGSEQITLDLLYGYTLMRPEHLVLVQTN
jgi:P22 coat protein - gene protein 5